VAATGLAVDDLPAIRAQVARATYGDAFMDELHHECEALRAAGALVVPDHDARGGSALYPLIKRQHTLSQQAPTIPC